MRTVNIRALKQDARKILQGRYSYLALATMTLNFTNLTLSYLLTLAVPVVDSLFRFALNIACLIVTNMIYYLLLTGLYRTHLNITQNLPFGLPDLTFAFKHHPEPIAAYSAIATVLQYGAIYLLFFLMDVISSPVLFGILAAVLGLSLLWFKLTYFPVLFFHTCDPSKSLQELMRGSRVLMHGHKFKLLLLQFSFLGVLLLGVLSLGIGMLFVMPYITMTYVLFCLKLFGNEETEPHFE